MNIFGKTVIDTCKWSNSLFAAFSSITHSFRADCVSWMLEREKRISLSGSTEIMKKKASEFVTAKHSLLIIADSPETELNVPQTACTTAKLTIFATAALIYTFN